MATKRKRKDSASTSTDKGTAGANRSAGDAPATGAQPAVGPSATETTKSTTTTKPVDDVKPITKKNDAGKFLSGIERDSRGWAIDPVAARPLDPPSQGGPLTIGGHTPGCHNAYGNVLPADCECQGREAQG